VRHLIQSEHCIAVPSLQPHRRIQEVTVAAELAGARSVTVLELQGARVPSAGPDLRRGQGARVPGLPSTERSTKYSFIHSFYLIQATWP